MMKRRVRETRFSRLPSAARPQEKKTMSCGHVRRWMVSRGKPTMCFSKHFARTRRQVWMFMFHQTSTIFFSPEQRQPDEMHTGDQETEQEDQVPVVLVLQYIDDIKRSLCTPKKQLKSWILFNGRVASSLSRINLKLPRVTHRCLSVNSFDCWKKISTKVSPLMKNN